MNIPRSALSKIPLSEQAFALTSSAIAVARYAADDFSITQANPAFCSMTGIRQGEVVGQMLCEKVSMPCKMDVQRILLQALQTGKAQTDIIYDIERKENRMLRINAVPFEEGVVVTIDDVAALMRDQEILDLNNSMMEEKNRTLETLRASLEAEKMRCANLESKIYRLSGIDSLSGLANRRAFLEKGSAEYRRNTRYKRPLALVLVDLDNFRDIVKTHGNIAGDAVIMAIAQICESLTRAGTDFVGRMRGEKFAILLPECNQQGAKLFAERLRLVIETTPIFADVTKVTTTASMGIASLQEDDPDFSVIMQRADKALDVAKSAGQNMISAA